MALFNKDGDVFLGSKILLQVISLLIAIALWFFVNGESGGDTEKELSCQVSFLNLSSELTLNSNLDKIDIGVLGPRDVLASLTPRDILCEIDIRGLGAGKYRLPIKVVLPGVIRLNYVRPAHVEISLLRYGERVLPVHISIPGGLPSGLLMDSVEISPEEISIKGPEDQLATVEDVIVQPTIEELQKGERLILPVKLIKSDGTFASLSTDPQTVELTAVLRKGLPRKRVSVQVPLSGKPDPNYEVASVAVSPSFVEIEGSEKALKQVDQLETETIDLTDFKQGRSMVVPLRTKLPEGVQLLGESSFSVNVTLKPRTSTRLFSKLKVETRGRSVYPGWTVSPETVDIQVEGPAGLMEGFDGIEAPLEVYVDVTNIVSRQLRVPVTVRSDIKDLKITKINPERVTVRAKVE